MKNKHVALLAAVSVVLAIGAFGLFGLYLYNNHVQSTRLQGLEAIKLTLEEPRETIIGLILTEIETYKNLRDMLMKFEPQDRSEYELHQKALKKMLGCLEDALAITEGKLDPTFLLKREKEITL